MPSLRLLALLLLAALPAPGARSQCAEPSALDLDAGVEPLRVTKAGGNDLRVSWQGVPATGFRVHRGHLASLTEERAYDHRVVAETTPAEVTLRTAAGDGYFLVNSDCRSGDSGVGRDSDGVERPFGGLISVRIGLQGGMGVSGTDFTLLYPEGEAFIGDDAVAFLGPYAPGSAGSPFGGINTALPGQVLAVALFGQPLPDPSFDPPPTIPLDIAELLFGYHGTPPSAADFTLADCGSSTALGEPIPEVDCSISGFDVLY